MERWGIAGAYERYMGRWSREVAGDFLQWLGVPVGLAWLDVGCGTGALTEAIVHRLRPSRVMAVDTSPGFVAHVAAHSPRIACAVARAEALPLVDRSFDVVVAGLVLNFTDSGTTLAEMGRRGEVAGCGVRVGLRWPNGASAGILASGGRAGPGCC
jgi:ubiquinone/menaquinone biosynthesis C-methylase UbiE